MIYTIFEYKPENFAPFSINHATFELRSGAFSAIDRVMHNTTSDDKIILVVRDEIREVVSNRFPDLEVNPEIIPPSTLFYSCHNFIEDGFVSNQELKIETSIEDFRDYITTINFKDSYLWSSLFNTKNLISTYDINHFNMKIDGECHSTAIILNEENIHISKNAIVSAGVILDASEGPIIIDDGALIDVGAIIKGNTYIGKNSIINPGAKLRGEISIGPSCKIGGEVECSIFHGFSNKQHDGYIGHSYIGEWVNLGANTNNSDLKNNYSTIKFDIGNTIIDTKETFIGSMVGDYSKTGISTMLNTGTYIGIGANIFGGDFQDKFIPSFSWGGDDITEIDKFLSTLEIAKNRRDRVISSSEKDLILKLHSSVKSKKF